MIKRVAALATALALATGGTAAFASEKQGDLQRPAGPVQMTDDQMDQVAAGALLTVVAVDVVDINNNTVAVSIPVNAGVAIAVLGAAGAVATQDQPGRIRQ